MGSKEVYDRKVLSQRGGNKLEGVPGCADEMTKNSGHGKVRLRWSQRVVIKTKNA